MDYFLLAYIVIAIFVIAGGGAMLFRMERPVAGGLFAIGAFLVILFYGLRWFKGTSVKGADVDAWPPMINPCPDYFKKTVDGSGNVFCEDGNNLYDMTASTDATFPVTLTGTVPKVKVYDAATKKGISTGRIGAIAQTNTKLRWEGVFNGADLTTNVPFA